MILCCASSLTLSSEHMCHVATQLSITRPCRQSLRDSVEFRLDLLSAWNWQILHWKNHGKSTFHGFGKIFHFLSADFHVLRMKFPFLSAEFPSSECRILGGLFRAPLQFWVLNLHFLSTEFPFFSAQFVFSLCVHCRLTEPSTSSEDVTDSTDLELIQHIYMDINRLTKLLNGWLSITPSPPTPTSNPQPFSWVGSLQGYAYNHDLLTLRKVSEFWHSLDKILWKHELHDVETFSQYYSVLVGKKSILNLLKPLNMHAVWLLETEISKSCEFILFQKHCTCCSMPWRWKCIQSDLFDNLAFNFKAFELSV